MGLAVSHHITCLDLVDLELPIADRRSLGQQQDILRDMAAHSARAEGQFLATMEFDGPTKKVDPLAVIVFSRQEAAYASAYGACPEGRPGTARYVAGGVGACVKGCRDGLGDHQSVVTTRKHVP